jgi:hypothetical protein
MRASILALLLVGAACSQKADHPGFAPACDPGECLPPTPGSNGNGNGSGGDNGSGEELGTFSGDILTFSTDFFDTGTVLTTGATVSAEGENGSRVRGSYDGTAFQLEGVLKTSGNWFLVEPVSTGLLPTLTPLDTRSLTAGLSPGLAQSLTIDGIFALMGTERAEARAQIVLHVVNAQGASIAGVVAEVTAERVGYRTNGTWLANDEGTDDSGLIFLGNVQAGAALSTLNVSFSGTASGRAEVALQAGAVTVATVVVSKK